MTNVNARPDGAGERADFVHPNGRSVVRTERRLHLDEVDGFGVVFFSRYWQWYQHTFEEYVRAQGHSLEELFAEGRGFPVVHAEIDYRSMIRLGDVVCCDLWPAAVGDRSLILNGRFTSGEGVELARAVTVHVAAGFDGSPMPMPEWLRQAAADQAVAADD